MFDAIVVKPIFNALMLLYSIIPGGDFGVAIILFTIFIRILIYPLVRKQLHQTKLMRKLQPELKKIKKAADGNIHIPQPGHDVIQEEGIGYDEADQRLELTDRALYPHRGLQIHVADAAALPDQGS